MRRQETKDKEVVDIFEITIGIVVNDYSRQESLTESAG